MNATEHELLDQADALVVLPRIRKLVVKSIEFVRMAENSVEIDRCTRALVETRANKGARANRRERHQKDRVPIAMLVGAEHFTWPCKSGHRRPPVPVDAHSSSKRKRRHGADIG